MEGIELSFRLEFTLHLKGGGGGGGEGNSFCEFFFFFKFSFLFNTTKKYINILRYPTPHEIVLKFVFKYSR